MFFKYENNYFLKKHENNKFVRKEKKRKEAKVISIKYRMYDESQTLKRKENDMCM